MYPTDHRLDKARMIVASYMHAGDWLLASPITSVVLRLSNKMIRVTVGHQLGHRTCEPHTCPMSMRQRRGRQRSSRIVMQTKQRKTTATRPTQRCNMESHETCTDTGRQKTSGTLSDRRKRPDRATLIPWSRRKPPTWDVAIPDTFAECHLKDTAHTCRSCSKSGGNFQDHQIHVNNNNTHICSYSN